MDADQDRLANPFGMDEDCSHCPALCETRSVVVHGYGPVDADFLFVGEAPDAAADAAVRPFADGEGGLLAVLERLGLCDPGADPPTLHNAFLTNLTRCHHPERPPTDEEVRNCDAFLTAEVRMINPEIIVPVGGRALGAIGEEYTTTPAADLDLAELHATTLRGRGFEIVPTRDPREADEAAVEAFVEHFADLMDSDYRQTKGRRGR